MKYPVALIASGFANLALVGALIFGAITEKDLRRRLENQRENVKLTFLVAEEWKSVAMDCKNRLWSCARACAEKVGK